MGEASNLTSPTSGVDLQGLISYFDTSSPLSDQDQSTSVNLTHIHHASNLLQKLPALSLGLSTPLSTPILSKNVFQNHLPYLQYATFYFWLCCLLILER